MTIQKILSPVVKNVNQGVLPFKASPQTNNNVDHDSFIKSETKNAGEPSAEAKMQTPQAQAHYIVPQTQVIEPQDMQPVQIAPQKKKSNLLNGVWTLAKSVVLIIIASFCASKIMNLFGKNGGGITSSPINRKDLSNMLFKDTSKFKTADELCLSKPLKELVDEIRTSISNADVIAKRGGTQPKSVLLYGPPGTGKTTIVQAIAREFPDSRFATLDVTSLGSKYVGETEKNIQAAVNEICEQAEKNPKTKFLVFIDEIDSVMMVDESTSKKHSNNVLNEFKTCFTERLGKHDNIITIASTNLDINPEKAVTKDGKKLDSAMLSRFQIIKEIGLPDAETIQRTIATRYKNCPLVEDVLKQAEGGKLKVLAETLAEDKHKVSFRTIESLIQKAANFEGDSKVGFKRFLEAIKAKQVELNFTDEEIAKLATDLGV
ncbi:ATP-binding protein [bacterium]|nr:ATP-binding protein [bacterium]